MSELVPGVDTWRDNVTAPSTFDPANGTEIKTGLEHLADRTFYLSKLHLYRQVSTFFDAPESDYSAAHQTIPDSVFTNITILAITLNDIIDGDFIIIESTVNFVTTGAPTLVEIRHTSDVEPPAVGVGPLIARRLGLGPSVIHTSWYTVTSGVVLPGAPMIFNTQMKTDAGTILIQGPQRSVARLMRSTN